MARVRLIEQHGMLHFPSGGIDTQTCDNAEHVPSLLMRMYSAGDCDTCPWPMDMSDEDLVKRLKIALYDETMTNPFFTDDVEGIELPDGTPFDF